MGYHTSAARATCVGCGGNLEIRAEFCRCTGARFWRSCHQSRVNERSESNRRHQASLSTFEVQGAAGRAVAIARCSVRRHRASCSSLDLSKTSSASVARTGPKKSHSEIISLSALPEPGYPCIFCLGKIGCYDERDTVFRCLMTSVIFRCRKSAVLKHRSL